MSLVEVARLALADSQPHTQRSATVTFDAPPSLPGRGDAQALRGMLRNLVDNALLYGGEQPQVQVRLWHEGDVAWLTVDDAGPGIPAAERERVFDRFHRREPGRGSGRWSGPLAIVRATALQHGGQVLLKDSPLGGLRAELRLPWPVPKATA